MTAPQERPLPCPMCGGEDAVAIKLGGRLWTVHCRGDNCTMRTGEWWSESAALAAWNRRAAREPEQAIQIEFDDCINLRGKLDGRRVAVQIAPDSSGEAILLVIEQDDAEPAPASGPSAEPRAAPRRAPAGFCDECRAKWEACEDGHVVALCARCSRCHPLAETFRESVEPLLESSRKRQFPASVEDMAARKRQMEADHAKSCPALEALLGLTMLEADAVAADAVRRSFVVNMLAERVAKLEAKVEDITGLLGFGRMAAIDLRAERLEARLEGFEARMDTHEDVTNRNAREAEARLAALEGERTTVNVTERYNQAVRDSKPGWTMPTDDAAPATYTLPAAAVEDMRKALARSNGSAYRTEDHGLIWDLCKALSNALDAARPT